MVSGLVSRLDRVLYPGIQDRWDDWLFRDEISRHLHPGHVLLDLGAGAGIVDAMNFRGRAAKVCGLDPDERVRMNQYLDDAKVGTGEAIPYANESFDIVFSDNVLEHLDQPELVFREVWRVLKPGGIFLAKTPNRMHYVPQLARLTPHRFHQFYNRLRGRAAVDTFPTRYRVNTPEAVRRVAEVSGLRVARIQLVESRPEYLRVAVPTYLLGWAYERVVNSSPLLERFRVLLVATLQKPNTPS
jgi:ubiquinone/menaquinone biosynthesis C-methylase UbiE